jgi:hypothetical protein
MIREICGRGALKLADQHGECNEGVVPRIFISHPLPRLSSRRRVTPLQRVQYIVTKHDVTAIGENVELHGGGSEKWVAQIRQVSPFDDASEHPVAIVERFNQRSLTTSLAHNARPPTYPKQTIFSNLPASARLPSD